VQDEITEAIVAAIAPEIGAAELERAERKPPDSLDAWDIYQRGLATYYTTTEEGLGSAIELFDKVNDLDPKFAPAFAMAAEARFRYMFHFRPDDRRVLLKQSQEKAHKGIALDPRDPVCLLADGRVNTHLGQHDLAISQIKEAIALNPNYAMAHYALGFVLRAAGRAEETLSHVDRAMRLSPHDAFLAGFQGWRAMTLFDLKRYEEAVEWAHRASRNPNPRIWTFAVLAAALTKLGRVEEARDALDELFARQPRFSLGFVRKALSFLKVESIEPFVEALREAGVPE
jgi:tetratricopeptide (TPR) repeat protein